MKGPLAGLVENGKDTLVSIIDGENGFKMILVNDMFGLDIAFQSVVDKLIEDLVIGFWAVYALWGLLAHIQESGTGYFLPFDAINRIRKKVQVPYFILERRQYDWRVERSHAYAFLGDLPPLVLELFDGMEGFTVTVDDFMVICRVRGIGISPEENIFLGIGFLEGDGRKG